MPNLQSRRAATPAGRPASARSPRMPALAPAVAPALALAAAALAAGAAAPASAAPRPDGTAGIARALPNAITLTREDFRNIFTLDPFGLVRFIGFQPGFSFHATGDAGAESWVMVRGHGRDDSRIILVLVDGRPINMRTNTVDLEDVIIGSIEKMIIHPGPLPGRFGGYHAVIEIETRRDFEGLDISFTAGSNNFFGIAGAYAESYEKAFWGIEVQLETTDAMSGQTFTYQLPRVPPFPNSGANCVKVQPGPPQPPVDGFPFIPGACRPDLVEPITFSEVPARTFLLQAHLGVRLGSEAELIFRANHLHSRKSLGSERWLPTDYAPGNLPENQRLQIDARNRDFTSFSVDLRSTAQSAADYDLTLFYTREEEELGTFGKQYYLGRMARNRFGARGQYGRAIAGWADAAIGFDVVHKNSNMANPNEIAFPWSIYVLERIMTMGGAFAQVDARPWAGATLSVGPRLNFQNGVATNVEVHPTVSATQELLGGRLAVFGSWATNNRFIPPLERERFSVRGERVDMERVETVEAGLIGNALDRRLILRGTWFEMRNRYPTLVPGPVPQPPITRTGVSQGLTAAATFIASDQLTMTANATHFTKINGFTQSPGDYRWLANGALFWKANERLEAELAGRYLGRFTTPLDDFGFSQGPVFISDATLRFNLDRDASKGVVLGIYNLTNMTYNVFPELPQWNLPNQMPGRQFLVTLDIGRLPRRAGQ
jgi:hypothetical protein